MRRKYLEPIIVELAAAAATGWPQDVLRKYDALSLTEALRAQGASNAAIDVLQLSDMGTLGREYNHHSALAILIRMVTGPMFSKPPYALAGGNELLPKAFAARLGERMCYGARVMQIEHNINGVHVVYEQGSIRQAISADYLVSAVPCSALRRLEVIPQFSLEKRQALEAVSDHAVTRFFFQVKKRFWRDQELSGFVATDLPISFLWDATMHQSGERGILQAYVLAPHARRFAEMEERERLRAALDQAKEIFPEMEEYIEGGIFAYWGDNARALGAGTPFPLLPGQTTTLLPHLVHPEGRVHFAGDHTTSFPLSGTGMQGALESGVRVAQEINDAP